MADPSRLMLSTGMTESTSRSDDFSTLARTEVRRLSTALGSDGCWICEDKPTHMCHVLDEEDQLLRDLLASRGMLNFSCSGPENALILCSQCHAKFDMMQDPGWALYPSDLDYFIDYENRDYELRANEASRGIQMKRSCPTAAEYLTAQQQSGRVLDASIGGLYRRVFLRRLHPYIPQNTLVEDKPWFGAPMAALRRAIHATGSFRVTAFRADDLSKLRTLQSLYARPDPDILPSANADTSVCSSETQNAPPPLKKRCLPPVDDKAEAPTYEAVQDRARESYHTTAVFNWILGPHMSTEDIVMRYAPVF